jgi:hypothetical protein
MQMPPPSTATFFPATSSTSCITFVATSNSTCGHRPQESRRQAPAEQTRTGLCRNSNRSLLARSSPDRIDYGLASAERVERLVRRPILTAPARAGFAILRVGAKKLSFPGVLCEQGLDSFEGGTIDDGRMLAGMGLAPIDHLADVEAVLEKMRQGAHAERTATLGAAAREGAARPLASGPRLPDRLACGGSASAVVAGRCNHQGRP